MRAVTAEALAAVTESHTGINLGIDDPTSRWCAAIAATHLLWRDGPLEDGPIGEVALSEFVGAVNVDGLRRHALAEARRLDALAGNGWSWLRTFLACSGSMREWFGVPWWPAHVEVFVSDVTDPDSRLSRLYAARAATLAEPPLGLDELATALVTAPEHLSAEALAWCVDDARLADVDRQAVKRRWQAAGRPRWAPASWSEGADPPRPAG